MFLTADEAGRAGGSRVPRCASPRPCGARSFSAIAALAANIEATRSALNDPTLYARRTSDFTEILAEHCGNKILRLLIRLLSDIVWTTDKRLAAQVKPSPGVELEARRR